MTEVELKDALSNSRDRIDPEFLDLFQFLDPLSDNFIRTVQDALHLPDREGNIRRLWYDGIQRLAAFS